MTDQIYCEVCGCRLTEVEDTPGVGHYECPNCKETKRLGKENQRMMIAALEINEATKGLRGVYDRFFHAVCGFSCVYKESRHDKLGCCEWTKLINDFCRIVDDLESKTNCEAEDGDGIGHYECQNCKKIEGMEKSIDQLRTTVDRLLVDQTEWRANSRNEMKYLRLEIVRLRAELKKSNMNGLELSEKRVKAAGNLLEAINLWFFKREGMESPSWSDQFISVCQLFEPQEDEK